jgi:uncharacterized protein
MLNRITFALSAILASTATLSAAQSATFEIHAEKEAMVPMRDGVKLATDIYRPARNGKPADGRFPVIFSRTPYGKKATGEFDPKHYVPQGYIVVRQDTRGRGGSEGVWKWMSDDRQDGYDAVEWIAQQPWSNGKIGMMGGSYVGATQHVEDESGMGSGNRAGRGDNEGSMSRDAKKRRLGWGGGGRTA